MKKFENFCKALKNLEIITQYEEPYDTVTLTGLVGLYEVCFEQSWKAMKETLDTQGFEESKTGSPKKVLKTAYTAGMIAEEEKWLDALQARNNVAHSYNEYIALDIVRQAKTTFLGLFQDLKAELEENWL